ICRVRPIEGLSTDSWPPLDTAETYCPAPPPGLTPDDASRLDAEGPEFSSAFSPDFLNFQRREVVVPAEPWPDGALELATPLYHTVFRENPREGLYFQHQELGPVPWNFLTGQPAIDASAW